jgi:hypothetical protein
MKGYRIGGTVGRRGCSEGYGKSAAGEPIGSAACRIQGRNGREGALRLAKGRCCGGGRHLVLSNGEGGELAKRVGEGGDGEAFDS